MDTKLEKQLRLLKVYVLITMCVCGVFFLSACTLQGRKERFEEIDVERINVVEKDGQVRREKSQLHGALSSRGGLACPEVDPDFNFRPGT